MTASIYAFRVTYCEVRIASGDTWTFPRGLGREVSSHRGTVNNWLHVGNQNRLNDMARELNLANGAGITAALNVFTGPTLTAIQNGLAASIRLEINDNLMPPELRGFVPIAVNFA